MADDETNLRDTMDDVYDKLTSEDTENDELDGKTAEVDGDSGESTEVEASADSETDSKAESEAESSEKESESLESGDSKDVVEGPGEQASDSEQEPSTDATPVLHPPTTWRAGAKAKWASMDPELQQEVTKREQDMLKGVGMLREQADYGNRFQQVINPYTPTLRAKGVTAEQAVGGLLNTYHQLETASPQEKSRLLLETAKQFGADLSVFAQQPSEIQQQLDPVLNPVLEKMNNLERMIETQQSTVDQRENDLVNTAINNFVNQVDEKGELAHPFFSNVERELALFIPIVREERPDISYPDMLEQAYQRAIKANPETSALIESQQTVNLEQERQRKASESAAKAKKANAVNLDKKGGHDPSTQEPNGTISDSINAIYDNIQAR